MASAGDGAIGGEAGRRKNQKRISDCLGDSDGADEVVVLDDAAAAGSPPPSPVTPRLRVPMFTCTRFRFVRLGRKGGGGGGRKEQVAAEKCEAASVGSSGWKAASSGSGSGSGGGSNASAEAGMGLSLLFLLAKTCVELNKMAEVRAQMEALLEEMRDQLAITKSTDHAAAPPRTRDLQPSTTASPCRASGTDTDGGRAGAASSSSSRPGRPRFRRLKEGGKRRGDEFYGALTGDPLFDLGRSARVAAASSSAVETASSGESETASEVESPASMDLAGQFQLHRDTDEQETSESSGSDGEFIELEGGFGGGNNNNPRWRDSMDGGDEEEHGDGDGVSTLELERRLQELRHRRSRERIEELEASLRRADRKLMEKEMEARLWKDTAKLALQPPQQQGGPCMQ